MAERPDLEYALPILRAAVVGQRIAAVTVKKPIVLRMAMLGGIEKALVGQTVKAIERRGHFVRFDFEADTVQMVVSPMLAGRFVWVPPGPRVKVTADLAVSWTFEAGGELRYRDDVQMGKVYVLPHGAYDQVPGMEPVGLDVLDARKFTHAKFRALARTRRDQAKVFLMDKSAIDAFGNAYADEALFAGGVHPKTFVRTLSDAELDRLHDAMVSVLREARETLAKRKPPIDEKLRDFLKVRNRAGEPCPVCGAPIRRAGVHGHDAFFCAHCQPETRKSAVVDWRKIPT